jgi:hypothetical protein
MLSARSRSLPAVGALLLMLSGGLSAEPAATNPPAVIPETAVLRSRPPRFVMVVGTNRIWNTYLMRWAEVVSDRVVDITGLEMPFASRVLRIVVPLEQGSQEIDVSWRQDIVDGNLVQELSMHDYEGIDIRAADVALCGLFLNGYVAYRRPAAGAAETESAAAPASEKEMSVAPGWLAVGVARNLYPPQRAENASVVLGRWERGQAATVRQILEPADEQAALAARDESTCGLFVGWLKSLPESARVFDAVFRRIAAGAPLSADWLAPHAQDCESVVDLEKLWDQWILRQKRVVYTPMLGVVTPEILRRLREELVVLRAASDGAEGADALIRIPYDELIVRREESWVPALARNKSAGLRILFMGRGEKMDAVIGAYSEFFDGLATGARARRLRSLLAQAEAQLEGLEAETAASPEAEGDR